MSEKSKLTNKLKENREFRASYTRAKVNVNIPSQIRALRRRRDNMTQKQLAQAAGMAQPRISAMERPGAAQFNLETLIRLAAAFRVGLVVKFASYSEMLRWENEFSQDTFDVVTLEQDTAFIEGASEAKTANELVFAAATDIPEGTIVGNIGNLAACPRMAFSVAIEPWARAWQSVQGVVNLRLTSPSVSFLKASDLQIRDVCLTEQGGQPRFLTTSGVVGPSFMERRHA